MGFLHGPYRVIGATAVCGLVSAMLVMAVRGYARHRQVLDRPNPRSSHTVPTPRLGGIGIIAAFLGTALYALPWRSAGMIPVLLGVGGVALLGLVDDLRPLPAWVRLGVQVSIAGAVVWAQRDALPPSVLAVPAWLLGLLLVLWIVWLTNLYNFMDGIDGLAAGQALFAAGGLGVAALGLGNDAQGTLLLLLGAASLGFLFFNFSPASIFMGDVGSTAIGFLFGCAPIAVERSVLPVEAVWIALGLFVIDATWTLLRRVVEGRRWYEAHREHWYQRPLRAGVSHRAIAGLAYLGMALLAAAAALFPAASPVGRLALLGSPVLVFLPLAWAVLRSERRLAGAGDRPA